MSLTAKWALPVGRPSPLSSGTHAPASPALAPHLLTVTGLPFSRAMLALTGARAHCAVSNVALRLFCHRRVAPGRTHLLLFLRGRLEERRRKAQADPRSVARL
jgi:hypothetical protein